MVECSSPLVKADQNPRQSSPGVKPKESTEQDAPQPETETAKPDQADTFVPP